MMTFMVEGRFIFEISPNQILLLEGPWDASPKVSEWEIAIMPFKPLSKDSPRFLNARRSRIVGREELSQCGKGLRIVSGRLPSPVSRISIPRLDISFSQRDSTSFVESAGGI